MADTKVIMPQMGESVFEGTLTRWLKKPGDAVARDEDLFEISTDKVDSVIPSPAAGTLREILVAEGQTVEINTVVAVIGDGKGAAEAPFAAPAEAPPTRPKIESAAAAAREEDGGGRPHSSPLVRRIAKEHGIDLDALSGRGTGAEGRITKTDILAYIEEMRASPGKAAPEAPSAQPAIQFTGESERVPLSPMRKSIAEHMVLSRRTSAHVTTFF
jgi:2-oxoglutarate dehydrogenase E2 component (dihydrolipoamide succinyltransferase)